MFLIGTLTAMVATIIDILINLLAGWKYGVVSSCILLSDENWYNQYGKTRHDTESLEIKSKKPNRHNFSLDLHRMICRNTVQ